MKKTYTDNNVLEWYESYIALNSVRKVGEKFNVDPSTISACCRGKRKAHKGYTWKYASA